MTASRLLGTWAEQAERLLHRSRTAGRDCALLVVDVDRPGAGSLEAIRREIRPDEPIGRLGGAAFVVLLGDLAGRRMAGAVADRISQSLGGVSIGGALASDVGSDAAALFWAADAALFVAKGQAGGTVCIGHVSPSKPG